MKILGRIQSFRAGITEPEPGRILVETDPDSGVMTTFTVEPRESGRTALVTISTDTQVKDGFPGKIQAWFITRFLHPIYLKELAQLAKVAAERDK